MREHLMGEVLAYDVDPEAPPGSEGLLTVLSWATWIGFGICVLAVIIIGAKMAIAQRHGEQGQHGASLGWAIAGAIIIGSAATIITFFV